MTIFKKCDTVCIFISNIFFDNNGYTVQMNQEKVNITTSQPKLAYIKCFMNLVLK